MEQYHGKTIIPGTAAGIIHEIGKKTRAIAGREVDDTVAEEARFQYARKQAERKLDELIQLAATGLGSNEAAIFEAQKMILDDPEFEKTVVTMIHSEMINAEYAVACAGIYYYESINGLGDLFLSERSADVNEVVELLLTCLDEENEPEAMNDMSRKLILVSKELTAGDLFRYPKEMIAGLVTDRGGCTSHFALIAGSMGIPTLCAIAPDEGWNHKKAIIDADNGILFIEPDFELTLQEPEQITDFPDNPVIWDGKKVLFQANISDVSELSDVKKWHADGIGLFRTEFLFMRKSYWPTEEEQLAVYSELLRQMEGKPVTIRTMDIGTDKQVAYFNLEKEDNPAMGLRGIRYCLKNRELFKLQLRALYRAGIYGRLSILYPMVTTEAEVDEILKLKKEVFAELERDEYPFSKEVRNGIMIETPSAALLSDRLAEKVDFFSIGTNDLFQFALAADRQNSALDYLWSEGKEAVMILVERTIRNANIAGIDVCVCGDLAGNPEEAARLIRFGADSLSMPAYKIAKVKRELLSEDMKVFIDIG